MIEETFSVFRSCGNGERECQLYWLSHQDSPLELMEVNHPRHWASRYGLAVEDKWISRFWGDLADRRMSVRFQVHTHPEQAFHSATDDAYPLMFHAGFLSLVIPDFALGPVGFDQTYLTEMQPNGRWKQVPIFERIILGD
ncbi:MAG: hypothetical protein IBJ12_07335 [Sphingomonadaceae bacterium]|nr:hypothetical protein [Sphingomonadaceae bacterium]